MKKLCRKCNNPGIFYKRGEGGESNVCTTCTIAAEKERAKARRAGTFQSTRNKKVERELLNVEKVCRSCQVPKDLSEYREYVTKVKGKAYPQRCNKCRQCEKEASQEKRDYQKLFNPNEFKDWII